MSREPTLPFSFLNTMLTIHTRHPGTDKLVAFPVYANRLLEQTVEEGIEFGDQYMTSIVPRGRSNMLASAVTHTGPVTIAPGHYVGTVGVDPVVAPYAEKVDEGTGVDGPYRMPSVVLRASRSGKPGRGVHRFEKNGESGGKGIFRQVVKAAPSAKIQSGKNFSGRTHDAMRDWARIRTGVLAGQLALYFVERVNR